MGLVGAMAHTACMLRLSFCDGNIINHYMCDIPPLLQLSCTSTSINELVVFIVVGVNIIVPRVTICFLYHDPLQHPPHPFCRVQVQSLQYLKLPHNHDFSFLWISSIHVSQNFSFWVSGWRYSVHSFLHHCGANGESFHLQFEEQRCPNCTE